MEASPDTSFGPGAEYRPRIVDEELDELLPGLPAIAIAGPKAVGKTVTAARRAATVYRLDQESQRSIIEGDTSQVVEGEPPILIDEWQRVPAVFDRVRRAVDAGAAGGTFLLTGSATPTNLPVHSGRRKNRADAYAADDARRARYRRADRGSLDAPRGRATAGRRPGGDRPQGLRRGDTAIRIPGNPRSAHAIRASAARWLCGSHRRSGVRGTRPESPPPRHPQALDGCVCGGDCHDDQLREDQGCRDKR